MNTSNEKKIKCRHCKYECKKMMMMFSHWKKYHPEEWKIFVKTRAEDEAKINKKLKQLKSINNERGGENV